MLTETDLYDGNLSSVANSTGGPMKESVAYLRDVLRTHHVLEVGRKEELIARVGLQSCKKAAGTRALPARKVYHR
jgi:hypothetical protein